MHMIAQYSHIYGQRSRGRGNEESKLFHDHWFQTWKDSDFAPLGHPCVHESFRTYWSLGGLFISFNRSNINFFIHTAISINCWRRGSSNYRCLAKSGRISKSHRQLFFCMDDTMWNRTKGFMMRVLSSPYRSFSQHYSLSFYNTFTFCLDTFSCLMFRLVFRLLKYSVIAVTVFTPFCVIFW